MSRSQELERFLGCLNGWTCESALPLDPERDVRYVHHRAAVNITLPLGPERTQTPSLHCHSASNVPIWYAHARLAVPAALPLGPERTQTPSLHCHSASNVPIWYAHARLAVPAALPLGPGRAQAPSLHCHSTSNVPIALPLGLERDA